MDTSVPARLFSQGHVAVQVFFSLSGFLITYSIARLFQEREDHVWSRFYVRRIFRIFPAWFVVLLAYSYVYDRLGVSNFLWNFFFIFGLHPFKFEDLTALHSWSLYVEEIFYLLFPLFIFSFRKRLAFHLLIIFLIFKALFLYYYTPQKDFLFYTPFSTFHYFVYGVIALFNATIST